MTTPNYGPLMTASTELHELHEDPDVALAAVYGVLASPNVAETFKRINAGHADGLHIFETYLRVIEMPFRPGIIKAFKAARGGGVHKAAKITRIPHSEVTGIRVTDSPPPGFSLVGEMLWLEVATDSDQRWMWIHTHDRDLSLVESAVTQWGGDGAVLTGR